ncbi:hypothetical protein BURKHO8Y_210588 [Burkholderia sp. 8Y]|nr:hypothetical protein BURKHO8Y_210588 [Burkholderia sp. 8Y]
MYLQLVWQGHCSSASVLTVPAGIFFAKVTRNVTKTTFRTKEKGTGARLRVTFTQHALKSWFFSSFASRVCPNYKMWRSRTAVFASLTGRIGIANGPYKVARNDDTNNEVRT